MRRSGKCVTPRSETRWVSQWVRRASGFVLGLLLPGTRMEDEKLGAAGDKVGEVAREGWEHGKQVAQDTAQGAMEAAKDSSSRHGDELSSSLKERLPAGEEQKSGSAQTPEQRPSSS